MFNGDLIQGVDAIQEIILGQTKAVVDQVHLELRMLYGIYIVQVCVYVYIHTYIHTYYHFGTN